MKMSFLKSALVRTGLLMVSLVLVAMSAPAAASAVEGPVWKLLAVPTPTNFKPGDKSGNDVLIVTATNVGGGSTNGSPITINDVLPSGF